MAIDTRNKRASVVGLCLAFRLVTPNPDATIDANDREQLALCYVLASAPPPVGPMATYDGNAAIGVLYDGVVAVGPLYDGAASVGALLEGNLTIVPA